MRGDVDAVAEVFAVALQECPARHDIFGGVLGLCSPLLELDSKVVQVERALGRAAVGRDTFLDAVKCRPDFRLQLA